MNAIPPEDIYFQDELRYGTRTEVGRRWMPLGERPSCPVRIGYQFGHLFTAICPYNGDLLAVLLPNMTKECFQLFSQQLLEHTQRPITLLLDKASSHRAAKPEADLTLVFLPTASPELNPVERFFKELRKELKCRVFDTLAEVEQRLEQVLIKYWRNPSIVIHITLFPFLTTQ
ncbi:MAG: IS630 family transposase [Ferruginibacter sp.]|nr:IS630 family transposase [Cytophagales bacterium]